RLQASAPQVRQHRQALRLCLRPARPGCQTVVARLCAGHRADSGIWARVIDLSARAGYGTGISLWMSCEYPVDSVVLSGVSGIVLSGVGLSCYQACQMAARPRQYAVCASLNLSNLTTLTIDKGPPPRWIGSEKKHTQHLE